MVSRFQIEDMVAQDASGVVFRALDTETGQPVAIRRFFPFGVGGGGLSADGRADYHRVVKNLAGVSHPAMRSIIAGGCDPVDGMPFIATEWVEGQALENFLGHAPFAPADAALLLTSAIEVCGQISEVLGEEAVWIETDVQTIIVGVEGDGRGITFWISPLKWLSKSDGGRGLKSLVGLTEDLMGWREKTVQDHEGAGLGGWLEWLRHAPAGTRLQEVSEKLSGSVQVAARPSVKRSARPPVVSSAPVQRKAPSKLPFLIGSIFTLTAISVGGWGLIQWNNARLKAPANTVTLAEPSGERATLPELPPVAAAVREAASDSVPASTPKPRAKTAEEIRLEAAEFGAALQKADQAKADRTAAVAARNGIHRLEDSELLLARMGEEVLLEGKLEAVERSSKGKGKTIYLMFSGGPARGGVEIDKAEGELAESALAALVGKKLRIKGTVRGDGFGKSKTPVVMVGTRTAIQEIP